MMSATPVLRIVAVLDTNVGIAGLLWNGPPRSLLVRATEGDDFILATSPMLIDELVGTLSLPRFRRRMAEARQSTEAFVAAYRDATTLPLLPCRASSAMTLTTTTSSLRPWLLGRGIS